MLPLSLFDFIANPGVNSADSTERKHLFLSRPMPFNFEMTLQPDGQMLMQSSRPGANYFYGFRKLIDTFSEDFKKLRHDLVGSLNAMSSDVPFSQIDPNYDDSNSATKAQWHKLSPDYWVESTRTLAELGTTLNTDPMSMQRDYEAKWYKYSSYLSLAQVNRYFVFLVSPDSVMTNFPLTPAQVDELCMRCRLGMALETRAIELLGTNPFSNEDSKAKEKLVMGVIMSITKSTDEDVDFNHDFAEFSKENLTPDELKTVLQVMKREFLATVDPGKTPASSVEDYIKTFQPHNTHSAEKMKRIINFPMIIAHRRNDSIQNQILEVKIAELMTLPDELRSVWMECFNTGAHRPLEEDEEITIEDSERFAKGEPARHQTKRHHSFKPTLTEKEEYLLAERGIGAKAFHWNRQEKENVDLDAHKGFHPYANTDDIDTFLNGEGLNRKYTKVTEPSILISLLKETKNYAQSRNEFINSIDIFEQLIYTSELVCYADLISCISQELTLSCKVYTRENSFTYKYLRYYKVGMIVKNTGSHIFVSYIFDKRRSTNLDTGRIGPKIFETESYFISDWCSYDTNHLEHYMKCGPIMAGLMSHYLALFKVDVTVITESGLFSSPDFKQFWVTLKSSLLIFLNNKLDLEELLTAQRYFTMNILDEVVPDPYRFVKRLPVVLRSRLTSYFLKRTLDNMAYYSKTRISKSHLEDALSGKRAQYYNLKSIVCPGFISIEQAIELFYIGYLISKNRSSGAFASFTICKKLFSEEFKYLKNRNEGKRVFSTLSKGSDHQADRLVFRFYVRSLDKLMSRIIGPNHREITSREIITKMANTSFLDLATLKASARPWEPDYNVDEMKKEIDSFDQDSLDKFRKIKLKLKKMDPSSFKGRPKAILAISNLMEEFNLKKGRNAEHTIELVPFCLEKLELEGGFNSDLFSKDQHGGIREITVLEISMRVLQYFVEIISRVICKHFESETLTSPENKEKFIPKHYTNCGVAYNQFITLCTSGDKKTWCQGHHAIRFANMLIGVTHERFHNFIYRVMRLWVDKKVKLPSDLISIFLANQNTKVEDPVFNEMRTRFYEGQEPFLSRGSQTVRIRSGMFQGLLHYASSVQHTMCQETSSVLIHEIWKDASSIPLTITVAQGSDDYAVLYSFPFSPKNASILCKFVYRLARFRARMTHLTGITDSDKTAHTLLDVLEYNSEWTVARSIIRPTLKWVIASLEISLVENFVTRLRQFSNNLTQVLEGGASTLECSLIQLSQAWLHYKLLGIDHHHHFYSFKDLILRVPDPAAGFFPLEADITCGLPGLDYVLYHLAKTTGFGTILASMETLAESDNLDYNGRKTKTLGDEVRGITLKFSDPKKWKKSVESSGLPSYDEAIQYFTDNPEVVFSGHTSWKEDRMSVALKYYSPGVRASLSGHQPLLRMMVAASYILNRPCFRYHSSTIDEDLKTKKWTLLQILRQKELDYFIRKGEKEVMGNLQMVFPKWEQYDKLKSMEEELNSKMFLEESNFRRRGKVLLEVFPDESTGKFPLIALCQRKWFSKKFAVKIGSALFEDLWKAAKITYLFLRDTVEETLIETGLNVVQLKFFIESTSTKGRRVKLMDTSAKSKSLYSTVTRIFWDSVKIRAHREALFDQDLLDLKSTLFSVLTFPYKDYYKAILAEDIIKDSHFLKEASAEGIDSSSGLRLFYNIINNNINREMAIQQISRIKDGAIGWFSVRQTFSRVTNARIGPGEWRGRLGSVSCILTMDGVYLTQIVLNTLNNLDQTVLNLSNFMKEIKVKTRQVTKPSAQNFYFKPHKGITRHEMVPESAVCVLVDSNFVIDRFDNVSTTNWKIDCTPYAIRLLNIDSSGSTAVLLSERISSKNWDRDSHWLLQDNTILHHWHLGKPVPFSIWREFCEDLMARNADEYPFEAYIRQIRKTSFPSLYDVVRMAVLFSKFFSETSRDPETITSIIDMSGRRADVDENLTMINFQNEGFLSNLRDVPDEVRPITMIDLEAVVESTFSDLMDGLQDIDIEEHAKTLLQFSDSYDSIPQEILDELSVGMPLSNNFFSTLIDSLNRFYPNVALENLLHDETAFEDTIGLLFSILSGIDKRIYDPFDVRVNPQDSISRASYAFSGVSAVSSVSRQQNLINDLKDSLLVSSGILYELGIKQLRKEEAKFRSMQSVLREEMSAEDLTDIDKIKTTISLFDSMIPPMDNPCPRDAASSLDDEIYWAIIASKLISFSVEQLEYEEINDEVLKNWIEAIRSPYATSTYWSILASLLRSDISFAEGSKILYTEPVADSLGGVRVTWCYDMNSSIWRRTTFDRLQEEIGSDQETETSDDALSYVSD